MYVPLHASQVFVRTGRKQLLLVVGHVGLLVEEVVVAHRSTECRQQVIGHTDGEQAGDVAGCIDAVVVGRKAGGVDASVVLHVQVGIEFILQADVQTVPVEVQADDGRQSPTLLVAIQLLICGSFGQLGKQRLLRLVSYHACHRLESI